MVIPQALVITGPTASGKSGLAVELALRVGGEVVSLDSVQVYRGADIGSAKLSLEERKGVPHHLIDILSPNEVLDAGYFCEQARRVIADIQARGLVPIVVGGTTMYLTALLHGLAEIPAADPLLRMSLQECTNETLQTRLLALDPKRASAIHPNDRMRLVRAIESCERIGGPVSDTYQDHRFVTEMLRAFCIVICVEREDLYLRVETRTKNMLAQGLVAETKGLLEEYGPDIQLLRSIGYREVLAHLNGNIPAEDLLAAISQSTRQLAKRQMTYFRNEPRKRHWKCVPEQSDHPEKIKNFATCRSGMEELLALTRIKMGEPLSSTEVLYVSL